MKSCCSVLCLLFACSSAVAFAQKPDAQEPVGIFLSRGEYNQFMGSVKSVAAEDPEMLPMIGLINDIVLNQPIGSTGKQYGTESGTLGLLADAEIRGEIEMVDDQYRELQDLNADLQKRMAEQLRDLDFSDSKNVVSQIRGIREQAEKDLSGVLLPHQLKRLQQIRAQSQLRRRSLVDLLTSDPLKSELEITDAQSDALKESEQQIEAELARDIARLQEAARKKLISSLNLQQQQKVEDIFGELFSFKLPAKAEPSGKRSK
jgi:hypothetical protein